MGCDSARGKIRSYHDSRARSYALANFFKVAAVCSAIGWVETGRSRMLALLGLSAVLGVDDKLNFLWVVASLAVALILVYGREVIAAIRDHPKSRIILIISALWLVLASRCSWPCRLPGCPPSVRPWTWAFKFPKCGGSSFRP